MKLKKNNVLTFETSKRIMNDLIEKDESPEVKEPYNQFKKKLGK